MNTMPDIAAQVIKHKEKSIEIWPVKNNYASEAGHECERYLFYQRTSWDKKDPHSVTLQFIFDGGKDIERQALRELEDAGFHIVEQARYFQWKDLQLSGKIDARIELNGRLVPLEIKGLNHREWSSLNSLDDMLKSKAPWVRRYPGQILTYQLMASEPLGLFYLKSKSTYQPKVIWVKLDDHLDYAEEILQKLARVNRAVSENQVPDRMEFDEKICTDCAYFNLCQPDVSLGEGAELLVDSELEEALERREELKPLSKEFEEVDKYVKSRLKGCEKAILGRFLIRGKEVDRKGYTVASGTYWRTDITAIGVGKTS